MAIRPVDLQANILNAATSAGVQRQAEVAAQNSQSLAGAAFAAKAEERSETVQETAEALRNRVEERKEPGNQERGQRGKARVPGQPFAGIEEGVIDEGAAGVDGDHLIDFTA
ncbi:MAG TPA: hypothetical protein VGG22_15500 [Candidatus Baltobacteraceae bacterium]